ncbi:MAG: hypothetical protein GY862_09760 [Gammaproteobacteria bacterium]|nr:hypothetical protein [Gammaproteobacteria bacterium]
MLKSYAAVYRNGHLQWLDDRPEEDNVQVIVTIAPLSAAVKPAKSKAALQQVLDEAWGCVKQPETMDEIDRDVAAMRAEWGREWE